jgi:hypothetical protein
VTALPVQAQGVKPAPAGNAREHGRDTTEVLALQHRVRELLRAARTLIEEI